VGSEEDKVGAPGESGGGLSMDDTTIINVRCPCCQHVLEIHVEEERVLSFRKGLHLKEDRGVGEDSLGAAVRNKKDADKRADDAFTAAQKDLKNSSKRLDDLFQQAKDKAAKEKPKPDPLGGGHRWD
jgi:hypothetical protein